MQNASFSWVEKTYIIGGINSSANSFLNEQIKSIPFFAQTSLAINYGGSESTASFSIDSSMKLREINREKEEDVKILFFSQAKFTYGDTDGSTANLGLGIRSRPIDHSMIGANVFLDYRMVDYSSSWSWIGIGGEYFWKNLELRNNWYIASTDKKMWE